MCISFVSNILVALSILWRWMVHVRTIFSWRTISVHSTVERGLGVFAIVRGWRSTRILPWYTSRRGRDVLLRSKRRRPVEVHRVLSLCHPKILKRGRARYILWTPVPRRIRLLRVISHLLRLHLMVHRRWHGSLHAMSATMRSVRPLLIPFSMSMRCDWACFSTVWPLVEIQTVQLGIQTAVPLPLNWLLLLRKGAKRIVPG